MSLSERALKAIWYPCSPPRDYEQLPLLQIKSARGSYLELENGDKIIDAISSWWCKSLGHNHPHLQQALIKQASQFEHVMPAHATYENITCLAERLGQLTPNLNKVFFAGDGSSAIEIALKMSLHLRYLHGEKKRQHFMALSNDYHGETGLALAVSDLGLFRDPYTHVLPPVEFIQNIPYVQHRTDPRWHDCASAWPLIEAQLNQKADTLSAIIVEPILQGAGNMRIYSMDLLRRLRAWCTEHHVHLIADEILTGMGRTGRALACDHAGIEPDFICLGKGLTSGWLPMTAVLTSAQTYAHFYAADIDKTFVHSHTHTGNALGVAVALATLEVIETEQIYQRSAALEPILWQFMHEVAAATGKLQNIRSIGAMVAADLIGDPAQRLGFKVLQKAIPLGALLRPLGNTLYWLPPLNVDHATLEKLRDITIAAVRTAIV